MADYLDMILLLNRNRLPMTSDRVPDVEGTGQAFGCLLWSWNSSPKGFIVHPPLQL